jgi:hypothetical protein
VAKEREGEIQKNPVVAPLQGRKSVSQGLGGSCECAQHIVCRDDVQGIRKYGYVFFRIPFFKDFVAHPALEGTQWPLREKHHQVALKIEVNGEHAEASSGKKPCRDGRGSGLADPALLDTEAYG